MNILNGIPEDIGSGFMKVPRRVVGPRTRAISASSTLQVTAPEGVWRLEAP